MSDTDTHDTEAHAPVETDGGHDTADYLDAEIHLFRPATPFMRDHLRIIWTMFAVWTLFVFGPVVATYLATDFMTSTTVLGFPLHYALTAIGAPGGALLLSFVYARQRDKLDTKYGIDHSTSTDTNSGDAVAATDGGTDE